MKLQTFILSALLFSFCSAAPGTQFLNPFLIQPQPDFLLPSQVLNFGPQFPGPFLPPQQNLPPLLLPTLQQEQPTGGVNPNTQPQINQDPAQGFPYYISYGFPPRNTPIKLPPNQNTANPNAPNQNAVGPTKTLQPVQDQILHLLQSFLSNLISALLHSTPNPSDAAATPAVEDRRGTMKVVFIAVCLIGLVCAVPIDDEHQIEKRSNSHWYLGGYNNYDNNNNMFNSLMPFLLLRLLNPPAPAPAPPAGK
ncbi:odontogenic, ameloblast asssociated isoform X1 [Silurus meridionalis]|nr:odontogenic, ameloblast asssociated isoform X1 [Silurus meridionalis]